MQFPTLPSPVILDEVRYIFPQAPVSCRIRCEVLYSFPTIPSSVKALMGCKYEKGFSGGCNIEILLVQNCSGKKK